MDFFLFPRHHAHEHADLHHVAVHVQEMALARMAEMRRVEHVHERKVGHAERRRRTHETADHQQHARNQQPPREARVDHTHRARIADRAQRAAE